MKIYLCINLQPRLRKHPVTHEVIVKIFCGFSMEQLFLITRIEWNYDECNLWIKVQSEVRKVLSFETPKISCFNIEVLYFRIYYSLF